MSKKNVQTNTQQIVKTKIADELSDEALDRAVGKACYCWANQHSVIREK